METATARFSYLLLPFFVLGYSIVGIKVTSEALSRSLKSTF